MQFNSLRMRRISLVKVPPNIALNMSRDGVFTASLGKLCHFLTTVITENVFLISSFYLLSSSLKLLPLALSLKALVKSPCSSFAQASFIYWKAAIRSPQSLLFSWWNNPLSACPHVERVTALWPFSGLFSWFISRSMSFLNWVPQNWM